jgi:hypothetical protein
MTAGTSTIRTRVASMSTARAGRSAPGGGQRCGRPPGGRLLRTAWGFSCEPRSGRVIALGARRNGARVVVRRKALGRGAARVAAALLAPAYSARSTSG